MTEKKSILVTALSDAWHYGVSAKTGDHLVGLVVKASASRAEDPWFEFRWRQNFFESSHTADLTHWHSSGYPARRLAL